MPLIALSLQRITHRDGLRGRDTLWPEANVGVGLFIAKRDRIDVDIHILNVHFFLDVLDNALLDGFGGIDVFGASRKQQRREADRCRFHVSIIPAPFPDGFSSSSMRPGKSTHSSSKLSETFEERTIACAHAWI